MSSVSGVRVEVEEQHHVSSNPMQTELGSSCRSGQREGATSQSINETLFIEKKKGGGGREGILKNLQRRTGISTDVGESHRELPRRSGE